MGYAGLATGAGAAEGLETLFARMRAEEQLRNQGRSIDIDDYTARSLDADRRGRLGEDVRQFDAAAPVREAQVGSLNAGAAENNANAGILNEKLGILKGLNVAPGAGTPGPGVAGAPADPNDLGSVTGRLRMSMAGIPVDSVVGPPDNPSEGEAYLDRAARARGFAGRTDPRYTHQMELDDLKQKPQTVIAQGNLDIRGRESQLRQKAYDLQIQNAQKRLSEIPIFNRELALAEFRNRIANDVVTKQSWMQWFRGEEVPDPSSQIEEIAADVITKYGGGTQGPNSTAPGRVGGAGPAAPAGDDLDELLRQRRAAQGQGPRP